MRTKAARWGGKLLPFLALAFSLLGMSHCTVKKTQRLPSTQVLPLESASLDTLLKQLREQADAVSSLQATTELIPSTGSAYSGVIEQYHDVRAFLLAERRETSSGNSRRVRMIGQAPIVRKNLFDMVADENQFRIYLPTKNKFITGPTTLARRSQKPMENLRPQHLLDALFLARPSASDSYLLEENEFAGRRYYAVSAVNVNPDRHLVLTCKWWFDRTNLNLVRVQRFDPEGRLMSDVHYGEWERSDDNPYPRKIELIRPREDYRLELRVKQLTLNETLGEDKFRLERPPEAELVELRENEESAHPSTPDRPEGPS